MTSLTLQILLVDDDIDDCTFFAEVLSELPYNTNLRTINDGTHLLSFTSQPTFILPDMIFLDLNLPKKNGIECLTEMKLNRMLCDIPVIIFSTSLNVETVNLLYEKGARYYVKKPGGFSNLKKVISDAIQLTLEIGNTRPGKEKFVIS